MIQQTEALIASTEAKILAAHPCRDDLVRAILSPNNARRSSRKAEPTESPE
ncbi:MAG: hypothetical protein ACOX6T_01575 [Myxococcales bacterium]